MTMHKTKTLVLLDAHAILHRAYHALPSFTSPDGQPTGALYGFATMILKIIRELKPDYIAAAYDVKAPTFRHAAYEAYKGTRAETDDELVSQFDISRDLLRAFHIPAYSKDGFEADDVIGTIVQKVKKTKNLSIIIASGDLDALQLVDGARVQVYTLRKGIQDTVLYDEKAVEERFGFSPELLVDFKGLRGDPSDNIPGVKGIGEKTASTLISHFGTLENILSLAKKNPEKLKSAGIKDRIIGLLCDQAEGAAFSKELATIKRDVPVSFSLEEAAHRDGISEEGVLFLSKLGFTSIIERVQRSGAQEKADKDSSAASSLTAQSWKEILRAESLFWAFYDGTAFVVTDAKRIFALPEQDIPKYKKQYIALQEKKGQKAFDAKSLMHVFDRCGVSLSFTDDIQILFWLKDPRKTDPSLEDVAQTLRPGKKKTTEGYLGLLPELYEELVSELEEKDLLRVYREIEMPVVPVLFSMEKEGICINKTALEQLEKKTGAELVALEKEIHAYAGEKFLINSPKELGRILFDVLGISAKGVKKTGTGQRSTRFSELTKLKGAHPIIEKIMAYREIGKIHSTYISVLPKLAGSDGRIHSVFHQTGTVTGRLSSSDPNMQNIPTRSLLGDHIRRAFVAGPQKVLLACDYSQIQLRIAALLSGEEKMLAVFRRGEDIHSATAAQMFSVPEKDITAEMRRRAKVINFGILYGMGVQALSQNLEVSRNEAGLFLDNYFRQYPKLFAYFETVKEQARKNGYVETMFGRKRFLPDIRSRVIHIQREAERMAINAPIQGSEADMIKKAMSEASREIEKNKTLKGKAKLILQIHDELLFEVDERVSEEASAFIPAVLENIHPHTDIDFPVETKIGLTWADLQTVKNTKKS
ncbi:MAG: DNA polymerase I [Candidatus Niyogibacteria bacterium CG10_big_fil_rev_8_21_14_0_10_46_36]|uniref:DNA polymerase I n=1 Tax=Candidatus Niyogibacteria bacterium CG10_big_fil_rev_8_21_14_0_10_46_36 TaxID=1974726 RepID=A0A2H0TDD3_9BACT|nr:MAG: DNA polymerase I [Candidatus Niyogibacteria bacterium CG10_big_fil_rev_8_21_14_0_10_46_36]